MGRQRRPGQVPARATRDDQLYTPLAQNPRRELERREVLARARGGDCEDVGAIEPVRAAGGVRVEVVEREQTAGGVPRHCAHGGFGAAWVTGPAYARRAAAGW